MVENVVQFELSKEFLERFQEAIETRDDAFVITSLEGVIPADITALLEEFDAEESNYVINLLDKEIGAQVITELEDETRNKFLKVFTPEEIATYVNHMDSDDPYHQPHTQRKSFEHFQLDV